MVLGWKGEGGAPGGGPYGLGVALPSPSLQGHLLGIPVAMSHPFLYFCPQSGHVTQSSSPPGYGLYGGLLGPPGGVHGGCPPGVGFFLYGSNGLG